MQAIVAGSEDIGMVGNQCIDVALEGADTIYVAGNINRFIFHLYGDPAIKTVQDLKGKKGTTFKAMGKFLKTDNRQILESIDDDGSAYQRVPRITKQEVQGVLDVVKSAKGGQAKAEIFYDNSFAQKIEASGFINSLYAR